MPPGSVGGRAPLVQLPGGLHGGQERKRAQRWAHGRRAHARLNRHARAWTAAHHCTIPYCLSPACTGNPIANTVRRPAEGQPC